MTSIPNGSKPDYRGDYVRSIRAEGRIPGGEASRKYLESIGFRDDVSDPRARAAWEMLAERIPGFTWEIRTSKKRSASRYIVSRYPTVLDPTGKFVQHPSLADLVRYLQGEIELTFMTKADFAAMRKAKEADAFPIGNPMIESVVIQSAIGPFKRMPGYVTTYPPVVVEALGNLYMEYNAAFAPLMEANREAPEDYRYCMTGVGTVNWGVQIDMAGIPESMLAQMSTMPEPEVRELLRKRVFEFENSLAMYQLLERILARNGEDSGFKARFRMALDSLRKRFSMPIALLAVTDQKYHAMKQSEFGYMNGMAVPDDVVRELSGFDRFFGPEEFLEYLKQNDGKCGYLLFARTSDPVAKLKDPTAEVYHPLLSNPEIRRTIKAHAITFNVDDPSWHASDPRRINDTKGYADTMRLGFQIGNVKDLESEGFAAYLREQGVDPAKAVLRCKPGKGAYGCYGHITGKVGDPKFLTDLAANIEMRGSYVVQPEMRMPCVEGDNIFYDYIDRIFYAVVDGRPMFLGGFRSLMPSNSIEARKGRIHGNVDTVWAEIVDS